MKRILLVLTVALVMAAMLAAMAVPAFAAAHGGDGPNYTASCVAGFAYTHKSFGAPNARNAHYC
jgi:hypothetical protein